jgi:superfamily II DNA/RNA helicase
MFDPITTSLIESAPALKGLDLKELPKRLTSAYANIVSARIRLRGAIRPAEDVERDELIAELRRLAAANEAYVALLPERENRIAAAFVAASAHQACRVGLVDDTRGSRITAEAVAPEICATLLFLIAEANADAAEAAKRISITEGLLPAERALILSIKHLAQGRLFDIARERVPDLSAISSVPGLAPEVRALQALHQMLFRGVQTLARQLLRARTPDGRESTAARQFAHVKELCIERIDGALDEESQVFSFYPGPLHLANLLLSLERDLPATALARLPPPGGVPESGWRQIIRRMARNRPYLWRNHREAIQSGYLEQGISAAISFPTGGGKSTLAELKIATALLRGEKVVFLAPTHALVAQTARALRETFHVFDIFGDIDEETVFSDVVLLPEVTVTTPERCLMLVSLQPEAFGNVGLIVFDECHLLHPREEDRSRRGLDAILTLLNLTHLAPAADLLLLSAMMKNTEEIAGWISALTGRNCLSLDLAWKPTRQVRGCVVYPADEIKRLNKKLRRARKDKPDQKNAPASVQRELLALPFGLFSLLQTWGTTDRRDYALLPLLDTAHLLSTATSKSGTWYLTPNGNQTSSSIAAASVAAEMKTLVFLQTTVFCESCVANFKGRINPRPVELSAEERKLRTLVEEEMGGPEYCYLQFDPDGLLRTGAASHHSLLLRQERELHEALFRRRDGIDVLFATSTLAQGMNLPSEVVIISGDRRFDPNADKMRKLEAHELLNAAGRAGRAGEGAHGFVLLVPSKVIEFDDKKNEISGHWMELQAVFEQADQCLVIDDPLEGVLDQIHNGVTKSGTPAYLLSKLPVSISADGHDPAETLLRRSLAVYRAQATGREDWANSRIAAALAARPIAALPDERRWIEQVAASTGLSVELLAQIEVLADTGLLDGPASQVLSALLDWLGREPIHLLSIVRPESLEQLLGEKYKNLQNDIQRAPRAVDAVSKMLPIWMSGAPLSDLEANFLGRTDRLGKCEHARQFVSRIVPDLSFMAGLPARLLTARAKYSGVTPQLPTVLATLGSIVREGCDSPEALAVRLSMGRDVSRVKARRVFEEIKNRIPLGNPFEDFEETRQRVAALISTS